MTFKTKEIPMELSLVCQKYGEKKKWYGKISLCLIKISKKIYFKIISSCYWWVRKTKWAWRQTLGLEKATETNFVYVNDIKEKATGFLYS